MRAVDVSTEADAVTGASLVADLEASPGVDRALVVMVRSGLRLIADRIRALEAELDDPVDAGEIRAAAALVDPEAS